MPWNRDYDFETNEVANPDEVDSELNKLFGAVNSLETVKAGLTANTFTGLQTMAGLQLSSGHATLFQAPTSDLHAATKLYADTLHALQLLKAGDTMTGQLKLKYSSPTLRLKGTEGSGADWFITEEAGHIIFYRNDGTEEAPALVPVFRFLNTGSPGVLNHDVIRKSELDYPPYAFNNVVKGDGNVALGTSFSDISGLSLNITLARPKRIAVKFMGNVHHDSPSGSHVYIRCLIDGNSYGGSRQHPPQADGNASFSFISQQLTAAVHTVKIQGMIDGGSAVLLMNGDSPVRFSVEETMFP